MTAAAATDADARPWDDTTHGMRLDRLRTGDVSSPGRQACALRCAGRVERTRHRHGTGRALFQACGPRWFTG
ncbi:MAG: hypothetical protein MJE77_11640 [Proteobacteria bacterium]|nr:hypothetical protein [Pseudomonadota bacterium]